MKITRTLTLSCLAVAIVFGTSLVETTMADPLDKSSPKIAHGMYRARGKSSPKIAHGMYRDRGKSSPKIAERMRNDVNGHLMVQNTGMYRDRGKSSPKIAHGIRTIMEENIAGRTNRDNLKEAVFMALELGDLELADELLYELNTLERVGR